MARIHCALFLCAVFLSACGGGDEPAPTPVPPPPGPSITSFTADRAAYFVGEQARLTFQFANGTGRLEPDGIAVTSGQTITTPLLSGPVRYQLLVSNGTTTVSSSLDLAVSYQDRLRPLSLPFARGEHAAIHLPDDRVLILGGEDGSSAFPSSVFAFRPGNETFEQVADLSTGRVGFVALALNDGSLLVAGGVRALTGAPEAELIRPGSTSTTVVPTTGSPVRNRRYAAATLMMDGRPLIVGGQVSSAMDNSVEVYDPATGGFTLLPGRLQVGRSLHSVTRIDQRRFLVYGGLTSNLQPAPPEIYDVEAGTSIALAPPEPVVRLNHEAITLQDGGILLVGGEDGDQLPLATVIRFDPATSTFTTYAILATPRTALAVNRLIDGRIFVSGGVSSLLSSEVSSTTELLGAGGQRRDGPSMLVRRRDHTVTRLNSGKLLVLGGLDQNLLPLASAEVYE